MSKEAYERHYVEGSGLTLDELHAIGRYAYPCDCGAADCKGWQMLRPELVALGGPALARAGLLTALASELTREPW